MIEDLPAGLRNPLAALGYLDYSVRWGIPSHGKWGLRGLPLGSGLKGPVWLALTCCVTWGKKHPLSGPRSSSLERHEL